MKNWILIAEDEDILRRNLSLILTTYGYNVAGAKNTDEAIAILKKKKIDLVITDLIMPGGIDGSGLIDYINGAMPGIPVIIITAYPSIENSIEAVRKGVFDYFTKPFEMEAFLKSIKRGLEKNTHGKLYWDRLKPLKITPRELNVLKLIIEDGCTKNREIAAVMKIKESTAKQYLDSLYSKVGVNTRTALVTIVMKILLR